MSILRFVAALATVLAFQIAHALELAPYTPQALAAAQQADKPVALHFHAEWCSTCRVQQQALQAMRSDAGLPITVLVADFDKERQLKRKLGVRWQSTLIVYRGSKETARVQAETDPALLRAALRSAL
ncbi:MAG: thioredoxin family protein [Rhodoferax sp.]